MSPALEDGFISETTLQAKHLSEAVLDVVKEGVEPLFNAASLIMQGEICTIVSQPLEKIILEGIRQPWLEVGPKAFRELL